MTYKGYADKEKRKQYKKLQMRDYRKKVATRIEVLELALAYLSDCV